MTRRLRSLAIFATVVILLVISTRVAQFVGSTHPLAAAPAIAMTPGPTINFIRRGDLTIGLARPNACEYHRSPDGLWITPKLVAHWSGTEVPPSSVSFSMTTNYGMATAGGSLVLGAETEWAIGGEPAAGNPWLGRTIVITVTVDTTHSVHESNEVNNIAMITLNMPAAPPGDYFGHPIACS